MRRVTSEGRAGLLSAFAAYGFWGVAPVYFFWVDFASPPEVLAYRIVFSVLLLVPGVLLLSHGEELRGLSGRQFLLLAASATLLCINWLVFVWALFNERMVEASLGYYINPLMTVFLGVVFLAERPRRGQWFAIAVAAAGIVYEVIALGTLPLAGLTLAVTFALYGLVRRTVGVSSFVGLSVETLLMLPLAGGYLFWLTFGAPAVQREVEAVALLALGGVVTIFPLLCFAYAAMRVPFTVLGFVQYLAPSMTLLLAVLVYDQGVPDERWVTFTFIWLAIAIFSGEGLYHGVRNRQRKVHAAG